MIELYKPVRFHIYYLEYADIYKIAISWNV
jgi:hypothetical protein